MNEWNASHARVIKTRVFKNVFKKVKTRNGGRPCERALKGEGGTTKAKAYCGNLALPTFVVLQKARLKKVKHETVPLLSSASVCDVERPWVFVFVPRHMGR